MTKQQIKRLEGQRARLASKLGDELAAITEGDTGVITTRMSERDRKTAERYRGLVRQELCRDEGSNGPGFHSATEMKAFRESKNMQLDLLDIARFVFFAIKADMGPYEQGIPDVDAAVS